MLIAIIGGGASGMAAALAAAEDPGNRVVLLERQARLGRKLQATGNGRCNLSNLHAGQEGYHGDTPGFSRFALTQFPPERTLEWFGALGLYAVAEESGRVYPYSDQANSVVDVLRFALEKPNVRLELGCEVEKIRKTAKGFRLEWADGALDCDRLIVACGGLAGTKLGGSMSGYKLLRSLGHRCTRLRPNLVQVKTAWGGVAALKGVRANCRAEILHEGALVRAGGGELQFTECGLSGPVMFELSRDVCQERGSWVCRLDFLPDMPERTLLAALTRRTGTALPASELFTGILHNRLGRVLTQAAGTLSGGNQQKVCIARALCMKPKFLFVSEPTRGIDIGAKKLVLETLMKLNREKGMTVVIVSSELQELRSISDRIAIVSEGKVVDILAPDASDADFGLAMSGIRPGDHKKEGSAQ